MLYKISAVQKVHSIGISDPTQPWRAAHAFWIDDDDVAERWHGPRNTKQSLDEADGNRAQGSQARNVWRNGTGCHK